MTGYTNRVFFKFSHKMPLYIDLFKTVASDVCLTVLCSGPLTV